MSLADWYDPARLHDRLLEDNAKARREMLALRASPSWWRVWRIGARLTMWSVTGLLAWWIAGILLSFAPVDLRPPALLGAALFVVFLGSMITTSVARTNALRDAEARRAPPIVEAPA